MTSMLHRFGLLLLLASSAQAADTYKFDLIPLAAFMSATAHCNSTKKIGPAPQYKQPFKSAASTWAMPRGKNT
jgi:hypothetical protein